VSCRKNSRCFLSSVNTGEIDQQENRNAQREKNEADQNCTVGFDLQLCGSLAVALRERENHVRKPIHQAGKVRRMIGDRDANFFRRGVRSGKSDD
jgi:hypothetical protein